VSELALLLLQIGFLILLWFFVFAVVYSLRADLFGVKVRKLARRSRACRRPRRGHRRRRHRWPPSPDPRRPLPPRLRAAEGDARCVSRIVITSGPKAGLELPLTGEPLTIGRSSESGLVIRDDYTSSHHAPAPLGRPVDAAGPRLHQRHLARRRARREPRPGADRRPDQGRRDDLRAAEVARRMVFEGSSAAISHTGKVRSNNQDSGYSGSNLFVVADGMGGTRAATWHPASPSTG
jgi:hypothetical protein